MKWTDIPAGQVNGAFQRLMAAFGENADAIVNRINTDEGVAPRVAALCRRGGHEASSSQSIAREIMGENFFGIEEAEKHFGLTPLKRQLVYMAEIPFSEETLQGCRDTHVLAAYIPTSIVSVRAKTAKTMLSSDPRVFEGDGWYNGNDVGNGVSALEWRLVRKTSVPDSKDKKWRYQKGLVDSADIDCVPEANVMVYAVIGHFLSTGERLFKKELVRTNTINSDGGRVSIGGFDSGGLSIGLWQDDNSAIHLGVASSRKTEA